MARKEKTTPRGRKRGRQLLPGELTALEKKLMERIKMLFRSEKGVIFPKFGSPVKGKKKRQGAPRGNMPGGGGGR